MIAAGSLDKMANSTEQSHAWETDSYKIGQEISRLNGLIIASIINLKNNDLSPSSYLAESELILFEERGQTGQIFKNRETVLVISSANRWQQLYKESISC